LYVSSAAAGQKICVQDGHLRPFLNIQCWVVVFCFYISSSSSLFLFSYNTASARSRHSRPYTTSRSSQQLFFYPQWEKGGPFFVSFQLIRIFKEKNKKGRRPTTDGDLSAGELWPSLIETREKEEEEEEGGAVHFG
jgi:hypothetical protein